MSRYVLDASAVMALLGKEPGSQVVAKLLTQSVISAVNLSEAASRLADRGMPNSNARQLLQWLGVPIIDFDETLALRAGELRPATRQQGLSLGDRACLATAEHLSAHAVTADRVWTKLKLPVKVRCIR